MIISIVLLCILSGVLSGVLYYQKKIVPQIKFTWAHVPSFSEFSQNVAQYNMQLPALAIDKMQVLTAMFTEYEYISNQKTDRYEKIERFYNGAFFSQLIIVLVLCIKISVLFTHDSVLVEWLLEGLPFVAQIISCIAGIIIADLKLRGKKIIHEEYITNDNIFHALQLSDYHTAEEYIDAEYDRCSEFVGNRIDCLYECMVTTKNTLTTCWMTIVVVYFFVALLAMW